MVISLRLICVHCLGLLLTIPAAADFSVPNAERLAGERPVDSQTIIRTIPGVAAGEALPELSPADGRAEMAREEGMMINPDGAPRKEGMMINPDGLARKEGMMINPDGAPRREGMMINPDGAC